MAYAWTIGLALVLLQAAPAAPPKPAPASKLTEPWPDAVTLQQRRIDAEHRRLFAETEPFSFTLAADFKTVNKDRDPESKREYPGTMTLADGKTIPVQLRTRGHFRLRRTSCDFVPLRVDFRKEDVKGTVFDGQDALKLGTHCRDNKGYEQVTLREYLVYRIGNLLAPDATYRARLARATYVDAPTGKALTSRYAMFIENDEDVARRMEGRIAQVEQLSYRVLDTQSTARLALFQYMIGNTDFSVMALHNVRLVQDRQGIRRTVTYDFDLSGLVNAPYAVVDKRLGIESVRDRLFRGPCVTAQQIDAHLKPFRDVQNDVVALYDSLPDLDAGYRKEARAYLAEFYRTIGKPGDVKRAFLDRCVAGM
jgi:hypothetical protein